MTESFFSCYTCGLEDTLAISSSPDKVSSSSLSTQDEAQQKMQPHRASLSRQADHRHGAVSMTRARSEERLLSLGGGGGDGEGQNQQHHQYENGDDSQPGKSADGRQLKENATMDDDEILAKDGEYPAATSDGDSGAGRDRIHRRAMSDPFDTPISDREMDEIRKSEAAAVQEEEVQAAAAALAGVSVDPSASAHGENRGSLNSPSSKNSNAYPTLPRYPVAATRDKNCWSEPPINIFSVRGENYLKDKKKVPSKDYLCRARGCDLFLFDDENIKVFERSTQILHGHLRSLPTLTINFQFPWGCILQYFEIPEKLAKYVSENKIDLDPDLSVGEKVLAKWIQGDTDYKNERLKLISYVAEGPWVVRNMVTGRPAIIGKKLPVSYATVPADPSSNLAPLLHCTLDIGSSSATAKRIVSVCRRYMGALTVDIGFVIQGDTADELPEQMTGGLRIHGADPLKAPKL